MAQHVTNYLCQVTMHRLKPIDVALFPWIDNFMLFSHTRSEGELAIATLQEICNQVGLVLKTDNTPPASVGTALGLEFHLDANSRYVCPTTEACEALHRALVKLIQSPQPTPIDFFVWFGHANYINFTVGKIPLCKFRALMNGAREMAAQATSSSWHTALPKPLGQDVLQQAEILTQALTDARCKETNLSTPATTLWTDACTRGLGMVVQLQQEVTGTNVPFSVPQTRIFVAEVGSCIFRHTLQGNNYVWAVDNTAAGRAVLKGHSPSAAGDEILRRWIDSGLLPSHVKLVPTVCQRADLLSRGDHQISPECTHNHQCYRRRFAIA